MKFRDGPHVGRIYFSPVTLLFPPRRPDGRRSVPSSQKIPLSVKWAALQESFFFLSLGVHTDRWTGQMPDCAIFRSIHWRSGGCASRPSRAWMRVIRPTLSGKRGLSLRRLALDERSIYRGGGWRERCADETRGTR